MSSWKDKLKLFIKGVGANLTAFFTDSFLHRKGQKRSGKHLVCVRLDAVGDYVLFHNFLQKIKTKGKYAGWQLTLIGNQAWKDLAETFDSPYVDHFIWVDMLRFNRNPFYRLKILESCSEFYYDCAVVPLRFPFFVRDVCLLKAICAGEKIGRIGWQDFFPFQNRIFKKVFTKLLPINKEPEFELDSTRNFFEEILNTDLKEVCLSFDFSALPEKPYSDSAYFGKYAVLFPGASASFRKWNPKNFASAAEFIHDKYGLNIVLCGGAGDRGFSLAFQKFYKHPVVDMIGKTSLMDLLKLLNGAELLFSTESCAPHLAMAVNTPKIFVVSNGNTLGLFSPYTDEKRYCVIYPPEIEEIRSNRKLWKLAMAKYSRVSSLDINTVASDAVIAKLSNFLQYDSYSSE